MGVIEWITIISCFFLGVHGAVGQLPLPLGGRGHSDTFGVWRPLQVKTVDLGQDLQYLLLVRRG